MLIIIPGTRSACILKGWIRIRIYLKGWIRIRIDLKVWIRIRMNLNVWIRISMYLKGWDPDPHKIKQVLVGYKAHIKNVLGICRQE
jgi:hypothetical protein